MGYSTGILQERVTILNRTDAQQGRFGLDRGGVEYAPAGSVWADVEWAKGKTALNAGSLDVYGVVMVRMRWNTLVGERSRIEWNGQTYQILGDTFHAQRQANTIQFHAQRLVNPD